MNSNGNPDAIAEAEASKTPAPLSVAWCDAKISAQQQLVDQRYAEWQQSLGALGTLVALRDLVLQQQQAKPD